tara:strand:- start:286 stop:2625 length:2340 start_codon:yes stop_codon:yes gene_type:complete
MNIRQNIFGLNEVYKLQIGGSWTTKDEVWVKPDFNETIGGIGNVVLTPSRPGRADGTNIVGMATTKVSIFSSDPDPDLSLGLAVASDQGIVSAGSTIIDIGTGSITLSKPTANTGVNIFKFRFGTWDDVEFHNYGTGSSLSGYFIGGIDIIPNPDVNISTIRRLDYFNDTFSNVGTLPAPAGGGGGVSVSSPTNSYFAGGGASSIVDGIFKIDYSNDTATPTPAGNLTLGRRYSAGVSNKNFGYFGGGETSISPSVRTSKIERIDFSNDTASDTTADISNGEVKHLAATGNKNFGYFGGGQYPTTNQAYVNKFDFSNDTTDTSPVSPGLSAARSNLAATGNDNFGYFAGGGRSTVDRIDYSSDNIVSSPSSLPTMPTSSQTNGAATGNASSGYWAGGSIAGDPNNDNMFKFDFSSQTFSNLPGVLPVSAPNIAACSAVRNFISDPDPLKVVSLPSQIRKFIYWTGGSNGSSGDIIRRLDYSNETMSNVVTGPGLIKSEGSIANGNRYYSYISGGVLGNPGSYITTPGNSATNRTTRFEFLNDTIDSLTTTGRMFRGASGHSGMSNNLFGYVMGGFGLVNEAYSYIQRLDFSNDSNQMLMRANLSDVFNFSSSIGNQDLGFIAGGTSNRYANPVKSDIDRYTYANDTVDATDTADLSVGRIYTASVGNATYGYIAGGDIWAGDEKSTVDRITFSNSTVTSNPSMNLTRALELATGASNANYGWISGGIEHDPYARNSTLLERIDFSNDSSSTVPTNYPTSIQRKQAGFSAYDNGNTNIPQ